MSLPDRNNPYSFADYLAWRENVDYYVDDPFIQKVVRHFCGNHADLVDAEARECSKKASFKWRRMAESIAVPEKQPFMMHYDAHHNRIDRIVRPNETEIMEREIFSEAMFSENTHPWVKLIKMFLIYQNGEACISCPLTCTEGMVEILGRFSESEETKKILEHCKEGMDGDFAIGAQYLSEIQGGSDVPANLLEAVEEDGVWKLYGAKFFCSATHADYAIVTAKPRGSEKVALFVMPSWLPGNKEKEVRNGFTIDRIKWKLGTSELTTAEITLNGAVAYPVGPLDRGVANVVGIVLAYSRLTVGISAGAFMSRVVREAKKYAEMRLVFGMPAAGFPLVAGQIREMEKITQETVAGTFKLYRTFLSLPGGFSGGRPADEGEEMRKTRFMVRELVMLQKITASWDSTDVIRRAMSLFGGHGVIEDFSSLPRLYRDSAVNELWEGPRNVLLTQIFRDLQNAVSWFPAKEFVAKVLEGAPEEKIAAFGSDLERFLSCPNFFALDDETIKLAAEWDKFCHDFYHAYQELALGEV
ncbi:acyl-CoA dehydrogenase family protein [Desulfosarcina sp. OttesenSCG-928-A07]|nr:acyl-CoA dehydrogenase family protein [Desulfosarcina sp. OttesenSCG-928-A07]